MVKNITVVNPTSRQIITVNISIDPAMLTDNFYDELLMYMKTHYEKKMSNYGYIKNIVNITDDIKNNTIQIEDTTASINTTVNVLCDISSPIIGTYIYATVSNFDPNKIVMWGVAEELKVIIKMGDNVNDDLFSFNVVTKLLKHNIRNIDVDIGTNIIVRVDDINMQKNIFIIGYLYDLA